MVRSIHHPLPDIDRCPSTATMYQVDEQDGEEACPAFTNNRRGLCCTFETNFADRGSKDLRFLYLVNHIYEQSPHYYHGTPFGDFMQWLGNLEEGNFIGIDRASISLTDERFALVRSFIRKMAPGNRFRLRVDVPGGYHKFAFPDNFRRKTSFIGNATSLLERNPSMLDVSEAGQEVLRHYDSAIGTTGLSVQKWYWGTECFVDTRDLVCVIPKQTCGHSRADCIAGITEAAVRISENKLTPTFFRFVDAEVNDDAIPRTHRRLNVSTIDEARSEAELVAAELRNRDFVRNVRTHFDFATVNADTNDSDPWSVVVRIHNEIVIIHVQEKERDYASDVSL